MSFFPLTLSESGRIVVTRRDAAQNVSEKVCVDHLVTIYSRVLYQEKVNLTAGACFKSRLFRLIRGTIVCSKKQTAAPQALASVEIT